MKTIPRKSLARDWIACAALALALTAPGAAWAQAGRIRFPNLSGLASKATNSVDISLDPSLIGLASRQAGTGANAAAVQAAVSGVKGIYVRSFQFAADHAYPSSDVEQVLRQLEVGGWTKLVSVHNAVPRKDVDVCLLKRGDRVEGLVIVAAEPRQLTIVNIVGSISLAQLSQLQGKFGVPNLPVAQQGSKP